MVIAIHMLRWTPALSRLSHRPNVRCTPAFGVFLHLHKNASELRNVPPGKRFATAHTLFRSLSCGEKQRYARLGMTERFLRPVDTRKRARRLAAAEAAKAKQYDGRTRRAASKKLSPFALFLKNNFKGAAGANAKEKMRSVARLWRERDGRRAL